MYYKTVHRLLLQINYLKAKQGVKIIINMRNYSETCEWKGKGDKGGGV